MPSPDTIATIAAVVFMAALMLAMRLIRPIGSDRPRHSAAWLDAHDVPATARYGPYDDEPAPAPLSALETVPDPVVSPFAARAI
jgi:hypothetical protein